MPDKQRVVPYLTKAGRASHQVLSFHLAEQDHIQVFFEEESRHPFRQDMSLSGIIE